MTWLHEGSLEDFKCFSPRKYRTFSTYLGPKIFSTSLPEDVQSSKQGGSCQGGIYNVI
jgi:hypothetical protein